MRCNQSQGHFRYFTTQLRESGQNNQDCQTPCLFRHPILQAVGLSQNPDSQKSEIQKNGNKQGLYLFVLSHRQVQHGSKVHGMSTHDSTMYVVNW